MEQLLFGRMLSYAFAFILVLSLFNSLLNMASNQRYTQEQVETAVELVKSKQMSLNGVSKAFGIQYAPLGDKVKSRRPKQPAPRMELSEDEEKKLVQWLIELSHWGFGWTKDDAKDMVSIILDAMEAKTVSRDNRPSKDWMQAFFKTPRGSGKDEREKERQTDRQTEFLFWNDDVLYSRLVVWDSRLFPTCCPFLI